MERRSTTAAAARTPFAACVVVVLLCAACDPVPLPQLVFEREALPVLQQGCSAAACHGVPELSLERGDVVDWTRLYFLIDEQGAILRPEEAYAAAKRSIDPREPAFSTLLRKPLAAAYGGLPHAGGENFLVPAADGYRALLKWIRSEDAGGETQPGLSPLEQEFARNVQPVLRSLTCMNAACHGVDAAVPFRLDPGVGGELGVASTRFNYESSLVMLSLDGEAAQSRLLRKMLPLHDGGLVHKGGNDSFLFGLGDARVPPLLSWVCREREERLGAPCDNGTAESVRGFVFVRGPVPAEDPFDLDVFVPGRDLFYAALHENGDVASVENLTGGLHEQPVDIRDPAVDESGRQVAFTLRRSPERGHEIFVLDLETRAARQLTFDAEPLPTGGMVTQRDPTWAPDGRLWFVSTRAGVLAERAARLDGDLYELDLVTGELRRRTATPHIERKPVFFVVGEEAGGEIGFSALRNTLPSQRRAHPFRFPPNLKTEYHQHFGITPPEDLFFDMRELPDGRYVVVVGDLANVWTGGRLAIVDRNFGPVLREGQSSGASSLPFYASPLTYLDPAASTSGHTTTLYRDPVALPDGRILVATSSEAVDLDDPSAAFDLRIEVLTLAEAPDGGGPFIAARSLLLDDPLKADFDPEPVYLRQPAPVEDEPAWQPRGGTGLVRHQGVALIDALLTNLHPSGAKVLRHDFRYVRLVEALPVPFNARAFVSADETRANAHDANSLSLGSHLPARVLAELALADDGTFHAEVPADVPFRVQLLDERRMAIGTMHNRWFSVSPGQVLTQGASAERPDVYGARCAACHGSLDGDAERAFVQPDVITTASLTLSRYQDQNPHRPRAPPLLGDDTRVSVDFVRDVQPILEARCASCHSGPEPAAGLSLTSEPTTWFSDAYESLLAPGEGSRGGKRYVDADTGSAHGSYLLEVLLGEELGAPRALGRTGARHAEEGGRSSTLTAEELLTLIRWIDLGASFRGEVGP